MAETFKCAFLVLAFVTSFQILFIEGRPIKPANKQQLLTYEKEPIKELASKSMNTNLHHSTADNQKVSLTSPPVHIPSVHHSKADRKESPPMVPRSSDSPSVRHPETPGANSNNGHSVSAFKDDFEPTTPGHSPGVGHIHADEDQEDNEDVDPKAPSSGSSTGRAGAAFKPTKPGHSPGVGHMSYVDQSDKIYPNPSNIEHSITTPGHSPGFDHILAGQDQDDSEDDAKEPGSESSIGRDGAAFKPTTPGHSPGIGHMSFVDQSDKTNPNPSKIEHSVTTPGHSPGVSHIHADEDQDDNEDVDPKHLYWTCGAAFKPTKPGHSPGVGHMSSVDQSDKTDPKASTLNILSQHQVTVLMKTKTNEDVDPKAPGSGSSTGRAGAAFKPTKPGHSPGVGHMSSVDQSDKTDPNPSNIEHSVSRVPNFQPLTSHSTRLVMFSKHKRRIHQSMKRGI
uniref:Precursor of CEP9 n=1 Tax=Salix viminalis TaxID=40686 RepID=A0A6N2KXB2_SALVM